MLLQTIVGPEASHVLETNQYLPWESTNVIVELEVSKQWIVIIYSTGARSSHSSTMD